MSDFKSKLPDFKELSSMTSKLFKGIKNSVEEIIQDYKQKRAEQEVEEKVAETKAKTKEKEVVSSAPPVVTPPKPVDEPTVIANEASEVEKKEK